MELKNEKGETLGVVTGGKLAATEGKESELIDNLFQDISELKKRLIEMESNARVASVLEKSIRSGIVK